MTDLTPLDELARTQQGSSAEEAPRPNGHDADAGKVIIPVIPGQLATIATRAEAALIDAGLPIYRRGSKLVRPVVETVEAAHGRKTQTAQLVEVDAVHLRDLLARTVVFQKRDARTKELRSVNPPADIAPTILARYGEWTFAPIVGVMTTPTMRPDGTILSTPGYDPETRLVLMNPPAMSAIPDRPTKYDALVALALLKGLLAEFPFDDEESRAVALSVLITPVVRAAFPVAPMHVASAPTAGSGKSYLLDVSAAINIGQPCPVMAAGRTEEETEKRLGAALMRGQPLISIDNLNGNLSGDALCQAVERPVIDVRILGRSESVRIEARGTTLFATGNNIALVGDMTRRAIVATLDSKEENPEEREFRSNPVAAVLSDRGRYIAAALTIVRAYQVAGRPNRAKPLASFQEWSDTVRSALIWLGEKDPVATMTRARANDPARAAHRAVIAAWADTLGTGWENRHTLAEVLKIIDKAEVSGGGDYADPYQRNYSHPELRDAVLAVATDRGKPSARQFGNWASRSKNTVADRCRLTNESDEHGHAAKWWVEKI